MGFDIDPILRQLRYRVANVTYGRRGVGLIGGLSEVGPTFGGTRHMFMSGLGKWSRRGTIVAAMTAAGAMTLSGVAFADIVQNNVVAGGNDTIVVGGSTTITYKLQVQGKKTTVSAAATPPLQAQRQ